MEAPKEDVATHIVKGKRTKRQRVQLLEEEGGGGDQSTNINVDQDDAMITSNCWPSPTSANVNRFEDGMTTDYLNHQRDEDEDMANCLMLLSQGGHSRDTRAQSNVKFNSRRFLETGSTASGKAGYYVYECKTCGKTFPSFQALGGHRASHKKPKGLFHDEKKRPSTSTLSFNEEDDHYKNISSLSLQLGNNNCRSYRGAYNNHSFINMKVKMHECAICGAEFASGQALGGHMRRHRAVPVGVDDANANLPFAPTTSLMEPSEFHESKSNGGRNELSLNLDLDLNLPAQEERASLQSKLQDATQQESQHKKEEEQEITQHPEQQQQLAIVIANPTLVDCHY